MRAIKTRVFIMVDVLLMIIILMDISVNVRRIIKA